MSVFPNTHAERLAPGSFQQPVPIPASLPGDSPLVQVCFNRDWLPYLLGCLFQLTLATTWQANSQDELAQILGEANNLILIFQQATAGCGTSAFGSSGANEDYMLRQNPDNPCELQSSVDGVTWCTWADISKCTGQPAQPGQGATVPPSGGCADYIGQVMFGSRWLLPVTVSTGDVIKVSKAVGTWASALDLFLPRCPDGNLFFQPEGELPELAACIDGTAHTESGDPAPTINHDALIAFDGTNYYDCSAAAGSDTVTITIPSGIVKQNLFFFANTPDTNGFGSVTFDTQLCNNQAANWTATLNFTNNPQGFSLFLPNPGDPGWGQWVAAQGWEDTTAQAGTGEYRRSVTLQRTVAFQCTRLILNGEYINPASDTPSDEAQAVDLGGAPFFQTFYSTPPLTGNPITIDSGVINVAATRIRIYLDVDRNASSPSGFTGVIRVTSLVISGTGPNPFA